VRELIDGPLPTSIKDGYLIEQHRFGALFGIPASALPRTWSDHTAYVTEMLESKALAVTPCAREMASFLIGSNGAQPVLGRIGELVSHALLPGSLAAQFGLRGAPRRTKVGLGMFAQVYRRIPRSLVDLPACREARRRLAGQGPSKWSAWTDRQLVGLASRTTAK
jgi:uncharacterized protein (DUF2236 family)